MEKIETIVSLDVGTSSIRAILYNLSGEELFSSQVKYSPVFYNDGRVRQSPTSWGLSLMLVLGKCAQIINENHYKNLAISVTAQRASVLCMDEKNNVMGDVLMWQEKTAYAETDKIIKEIPEADIYKITGLRADSYFSMPKILWLKYHEPDIFYNTYKFLGIQDYVICQLTGKYITDHSQACRTMMMDIKSCEWNEDLLKAACINKDKLPELVPPGSVVGKISIETAMMTGLNAETVVVIAGGDQQTAAIGMGVIDEGSIEANTGTGAFLITHTDKPVFHPEMKTLCSASVIKGKWVVEAGILTGGALYHWFGKEFVHSEAASPTMVDYPTLDNLVKSSPVGANGIVALPHFKGASAPFWNPYAKGVFFNLTLANTRADMARALLESVVLDMGENLNLIQSLISSKFREVIVAGGLTTLDIYNQIQADVFNLPVRMPPTVEATAKGALICAMVALGIEKDHMMAFSRVGSVNEKTFNPIKNNVKLYTKTFEFRNKLYNTLEKGNMYKDSFDYNNYLKDSIKING